MLDEQTFNTVRTILVNWHAFGSPRSEKLPSRYGDELARIRTALEGSNGEAADIEGRVAALVPEGMAVELDTMLKDGPSERELNMIREKCPPALAEKLVEIGKADTGPRPQLNRPWGRYDLLPWLLVLPTGPAVSDLGQALKPLLDIKDWWLSMEDAL
jgi:hypothetical protein